MSGLIFLIAAAACLWLGYKLVRRMRSPSGRAIVILAMLLIPTADAYYGRLKLDRLCATEGGLKVYRVVQGVDGFFSPFTAGTFLDKHPFQFLESGDPNIGFVRFSRGPAGGVITQQVSELRSRYEYRKVPGESRDIYKRDAFQVVARDTHEVLGEIVRFTFAGGWVERVIADMLGGSADAGNCQVGNANHIQEQVIDATLKPARQLER